MHITLCAVSVADPVLAVAKYRFKAVLEPTSVPTLQALSAEPLLAEHTQVGVAENIPAAIAYT